MSNPVTDPEINGTEVGSSLTPKSDPDEDLKEHT